MIHNVTLTDQEAWEATQLELRDAINATGLSEDEAIKMISGNHVGARFAVAKALNLYPKIGSFDPEDMVSSTGAKIKVYWAQRVDKYYKLHKRYDDFVYFLVTGSNPYFQIHGYVPADRFVASDDGGFTFYHHVLLNIPEDKVHTK